MQYSVYSAGAKYCDLCLTEKTIIMLADNNSLNIRSEIGTSIMPAHQATYTGNGQTIASTGVVRIFRSFLPIFIAAHWAGWKTQACQHNLSTIYTGRNQNSINSTT